MTLGYHYINYFSGHRLLSALIRAWRKIFHRECCHLGVLVRNFPDIWFFIWSFCLKQYINIKITIKGYQNYKARERRLWSRLAIIILSAGILTLVRLLPPVHIKRDHFDKTSWGLLISDPRAGESELGPGTGQVTMLSRDRTFDI